MASDREKFAKVEWVIFDADGVLTREDDYWLAAEMVVLEVLFSGQFMGLRNDVLRTVLHKPGAAVVLNRFVSPGFIAAVKNAGIANNWDLTFFSLALYLTDFLSNPDASNVKDRFEKEGPTEETLRALGEVLQSDYFDVEQIDKLSEPFFRFSEKYRPEARPDPKGTAPFEKGRYLEEALLEWQRQRTGISAPMFRRGGTFWEFCRNLFQNIYLGDALCAEEGWPKTSQLPKDGLMSYEGPLLPLPRMVDALTLLSEARIKMGIATGRPFNELMKPIGRWGIEHLFEKGHIATYRDVARAEAAMREKGRTLSLSKPHPYLFLKAIFPEKSDEELVEMKLPISRGEKYLVVGDAPVDLMAGKMVGCRTAAVLSGVRSLETADVLRRLGPDFVLKDISELKKLF